MSSRLFSPSALLDSYCLMASIILVDLRDLPSIHQTVKCAPHASTKWDPFCVFNINAYQPSGILHTTARHIWHSFHRASALLKNLL